MDGIIGAVVSSIILRFRPAERQVGLMGDESERTILPQFCLIDVRPEARVILDKQQLPKLVPERWGSDV